MKMLSAAIVAITLCPAIGQAAGDARFDLTNGSAMPAVPSVSVPVDASELNGRFCWAGKPDALALSLGMPAAFCIEDAHVVRNGAGYGAEITGKPFKGTFGAVKAEGNTWKTVLFANGEYNGSCSEEKSAAIEMTFQVDSLGYLTGTPVISAASEETYDNCHSAPNVSEIVFARAGLASAAYSWKRGFSAEADALGMPAKVAIRGMHFEKDMLVIETGTAAGKYKVNSTPAAGGLKRAEAGIFSAQTGYACSEGSSAEILISFLTDASGAVLTEPVLEANTGYTYDVCHSGHRYTEVPFSRE